VDELDIFCERVGGSRGGCVDQAVRKSGCRKRNIENVNGPKLTAKPRGGGTLGQSCLALRGMMCIYAKYTHQHTANAEKRCAAKNQEVVDVNLKTGQEGPRGGGPSVAAGGLAVQRRWAVKNPRQGGWGGGVGGKNADPTKRIATWGKIGRGGAEGAKQEYGSKPLDFPTKEWTADIGSRVRRGTVVHS